jgi:glycosyltransferase involved in cell wall biosynthesis
MRIAIYHNLPSGGAKRTLQEQVKRLASKHQIRVFSLSCANHGFADLRPFVQDHQVHSFEPLPLLRSPFGRLNQFIRLVDVMRLRRLIRVISDQVRRDSDDVILVHPCQFETAPSILKFLSDLPTVYYCHEPFRLLYETMPPRPYDQVELKRRQILNKIDPLPSIYRETRRKNDWENTRSARRVLVNSKYTKEAVDKIYGVDAHVSYHGIDASYFRPINVLRQNIFLSVGSLTPLKGFDFLIQVMAKLPLEGRPVLVIASNFQNPEERIYLEQLAQECRIELKLMGNIGDQELVELYNQARITLYAPIGEPFGLVPLESMACGTPVVAVRDGGIQETIVDGITGILVERDVQKFAQAIQRLCAEPALADELGANGRRHVLDHWTWESAIEVLQDHLYSIGEN